MKCANGLKVYFVLLIVLCSIIGILAGPEGAGAYSADDLIKLNRTSHCPACDLSGADLNRGYLSGANLLGANLSRADLTDANLRWADLTDANLGEAKLLRANLDGANLSDANLRGADLSYANLSDANLLRANLLGANLSDANLRGADLRGAKLLGALLSRFLSRANLSGADLRGANLLGADLSYVNLSDANLSDANLSGADLSGANLRGADLRGAKLPVGADLRWADLTDANLSRADLTDANLGGANLLRANLLGANLHRADLSYANLSDANLSGANLSYANLHGANLFLATWTDGSKCSLPFIGVCVKSSPSPPAVSQISVDSLTPVITLPASAATSKILSQKLVADAPGLILKTRYFVLYEGERPLLAIETNGISVQVIDGVLHYGGTYAFYVIDVSTTNELMDAVGPVTFTTPVKPSDEDNYGNPLIAQGLKDGKGQNIPLGDNKLSTLIAAGVGILPQLALLTEIKNANGVLKDQSGNTITTMNTDDVRVILSKGGLGREVVIAPSGTNLLETIRPLSDTGYLMDNTGKMNPYLTIVPSNINLPLGLFDFSISIATETNTTDVVIIPPTPFAADTKWYKVDKDGSLKEHPHFRVDARGNGILTLLDNDEYDANPAFGIIRDPGGPGVVSAVATDSGSSRTGCFIATAAFGSYLHPFVNILRTFRDRVLLVSSIGSSFVEWYYRVSPPIADVISRHSVLSKAVRILLLPAIAIAWLCLKAGVVSAVFMLFAFCAFISIVIRIGKRKFLHPTP